MHTFHTFVAKLCPIKIEHIDTNGDWNDAFEGAFDDRYRCRAACLLIQMMKQRYRDGFSRSADSPGRFREFTEQELRRYAEARNLMPWEHNPSYRQGFERLVRDGYIVPTADGGYKLSLELVCRCFGCSPDIGIGAEVSSADAPVDDTPSDETPVNVNAV